jgi:hypothetical protein
VNPPDTGNSLTLNINKEAIKPPDAAISFDILNRPAPEFSISSGVPRRDEPPNKGDFPIAVDSSIPVPRPTTAEPLQCEESTKPARRESPSTNDEIMELEQKVKDDMSNSEESRLGTETLTPGVRHMIDESRHSADVEINAEPPSLCDASNTVDFSKLSSSDKRKIFETTAAFERPVMDVSDKSGEHSMPIDAIKSPDSTLNFEFPKFLPREFSMIGEGSKPFDRAATAETANRVEH